MIIVTTENSIFFVSGLFKKIELGETPKKIKWGKIDPASGTMQPEDGELLQLVGVGSPTIIKSTAYGMNRMLQFTVEKIIESGSCVDREKPNGG